MTSTQSSKILFGAFLKHFQVARDQSNDEAHSVDLYFERFNIGRSSYHLQIGRFIWYEGKIEDCKKAFKVDELSTIVKVSEPLDISVESILIPSYDQRALTRGNQALPDATSTVTSTNNSLFTPTNVSEYYQFPSSKKGNGQCIGIIELGGGFVETDLNTYLKSVGIDNPPKVTIVEAGAKSDPGFQNFEYDKEVMMDVEIISSIVPKADLALYFGPANGAGFISTLNAAIHGSQAKPDVISISWGMVESSWHASEISSFQTLLEDAKNQNITVLVSSGDYGSDDGIKNGLNVNYPASSPLVLACGGTMFQNSGSKITGEVVWNTGKNASGGGYSTLFSLPDWQSVGDLSKIITQNKRAIPDIAGNAVRYRTQVDGLSIPNGGTSAVAPLWAALITQINETKNGRSGHLNATLYEQKLKANKDLFYEITEGNNGAYQAGSPWNACTGLGSPKAQNILKALT